MGQAKQRGSFEQRQAEGIARREAEERQRLEAIAAAEAALTPEQRRKRCEAVRVLGTVAAMAMADPYTLGVMRACRMLQR